MNPSHFILFLLLPHTSFFAVYSFYTFKSCVSLSFTVGDFDARLLLYVHHMLSKRPFISRYELTLHGRLFLSLCDFKYYVYNKKHTFFS